jgi:AAA domain
MLSQVALRSLDRLSFEPAFVLVYPGMGKGDLLGPILKELAPRTIYISRQTADKLALVQDKALDLYGKGKQLVVIIDEAHFLKADALHILQSLSNLETELEKLITGPALRHEYGNNYF